jgi:hypothetical protein
MAVVHNHVDTALALLLPPEAVRATGHAWMQKCVDAVRQLHPEHQERTICA